MRIFLISIFFLSHFYVNSQFGFEYDASIDVSVNGVSKLDAWGGGLDYAQFSTIDVDYDGVSELFVFDRASNNVRLFKKTVENGISYWSYIYGAQSLFPADLMYRATTYDYDADGRMDLFTYSIGGLKVYRNIGDAQLGLQWELKKEIVYSDYNGFVSNLYVASGDIPALVDVDFDGDMDVLTFHQNGQHLEYHKNISMEQYGVPDSLEFQLANECWGKFSEGSHGNDMVLNSTLFPCENGTLPNPEIVVDRFDFVDANTENMRHSGSTTLALDYDNNGAMDLIMGDISYDNLMLLLNGGDTPNTNSPMVSIETNFPSNSNTALLHSFPAPFYVDVDFDGVKDLVVGANAKNGSVNDSSVLWYKNVATTSNPVFEYRSNAFLQEQMIDHGSGSIPVLEDVDHDGLDDLLVANFYRYKKNDTRVSSIAYYKNVGNAQQPSFSLVTTNWLGLDTLGLGLRLVPTFGDLTNDGINEMILGTENGSLLLFTQVNQSFSNSFTPLKDVNQQAIKVSGGAFPQLVDLNRDGLLDLVIGNYDGTIHYYQNVGNLNEPLFQLQQQQLGGINLESNDYPSVYSAPHFFEWGNEFHLFLGSVDGKLHYYKDIDSNLGVGQNFTLVDDSFLSLNVGAFSTFFVNDFDGDNLLNLFVGQALGGLHHFEVDPTSSASVESLKREQLLTVAPNPFQGQLVITSETKEVKQVTMTDLFGNQLKQFEVQDRIEMDLSELASGIYLLHCFNSQGEKQVFKVMKR